MDRERRSRPPRVLLSYSHDSPEHQERVLELADRLRAEGVDARLDQYEAFPEQGWPLWMLHEIEAADFVVAVCTETYRRRFEGHEEPGRGRGATGEGAILTQAIYDAQMRNRRIVPVVLAAADEPHVPAVLRGATRFDLGSAGGYENLYRLLTGQPAVALPELGARRELPPRERRTSFLGEPVAPEAVHRDEALGELHRRRRALQTRYDDLSSAGEDASSTLAELLAVKSRLRAGGLLRPDDELAGRRYRLIEPLGRGGFATVWKAWDLRLRRWVAIKVLHGDHTEDRSRRERFFRGARQMARLEHPNVVRVLAEELEDDGYYFFVMEYLPGGDLRQAVLAGRLTTDQAIDALLKVGAALAFAHKRRVVHRDVKPANVLLDADGRPKLTDFDLVRAFDTTGGTRTAAHVGTFLYAAPESMTEGRDATAAADQYSLAMTLCFVLAGADLPLSAVFDLAAFRRGLPCGEALQKVLARATALDPLARYPSVAAFLNAVASAWMLETGPAAAPGASVAPLAEEPARRPPPAEAAPPAEPLPPGGAGERLAKFAGGSFVDETGGAGRPRWLEDAQQLTAMLETGAEELLRAGQDEELLAAVEGLAGPIARDVGTLGLAAWALDYLGARSRSGEVRERAAALRQQLAAPWRARRPPPADEFRWAAVPRGTLPRPRVRLVKVSPFQVLAHPVTNRQWRLLFPGHAGADELPAVRLTWYQAYGFAAWAGGRLPTEAEWEYAARGGSPFLYADHAGRPVDLEAVAWTAAVSGGVLHPVGTKEPNPWGLADALGNVWEWVADWYADLPAVDLADPWGPPGGLQRVLRGGSAWVRADWAHPAFRLPWPPSNPGDNRGFRIVLPGPSAP